MTGLTPVRQRALATQAGFTLMELMVTIVCAGILFSLALPSFRTLLQNDQQWSTQTQLVMSLNAARSEAIKQDVTNSVQVCSSVDGKTCGGTWSQGWIVLNSADPVNPPTVIQSVGAAPAGTTVSAIPNLPVTFQSNGTTTGAAVGFTVCDARGAAQARYLQVNAMGRVVASPWVGKDLNQAALVCP
jgi:type IV fimbrial biogenesis protein FimT